VTHAYITVFTRGGCLKRTKRQAGPSHSGDGASMPLESYLLLTPMRSSIASATGRLVAVA
jgi:hypothetical protein